MNYPEFSKKISEKLSVSVTGGGAILISNATGEAVAIISTIDAIELISELKTAVNSAASDLARLIKEV